MSKSTNPRSRISESLYPSYIHVESPYPGRYTKFIEIRTEQPPYPSCRIRVAVSEFTEISGDGAGSARASASLRLGHAYSDAPPRGEAVSGRRRRRHQTLSKQLLRLIATLCNLLLIATLCNLLELIAAHTQETQDAEVV